MKLRASQVLGYAAGDAGNNLAFTMASMFLLLYYTDVAGIPATMAGTIFLVVRIWDGVGDLIAGRLVDRTSSRWGKFRPWILFGSLPLLLLSVATFYVPDWNLTAKVIYAYVTYSALAFAYSLVNIPYGALAAAMTQDPTGRARLAMGRTFGAVGTGVVLSVIVAPQVRNAANLQGTLLLTTLSFVVVGFVLYLLTFFTAQENVPRHVEQVSLRQSLLTLKRNRPLILLCSSSLLLLTAFLTRTTIGVYYARDVLGDAGYQIGIALASGATIFVVAPFVPKIVRWIGKKQGFIAGATIMVGGSVGILLVPASMPVIAIGFFIVSGCGLGLVSTLMWSLEADTVEYGEWKTGVRTEGATYAVYSSVRKIGQALGGAAASYSLALTGYVGGAEVQSTSTVLGIRAAAGLLPAVLGGAAIVVMVFYPLTERRFREINEEVVQRGAKQRTGTVAPASRES